MSRRVPAFIAVLALAAALGTGALSASAAVPTEEVVPGSPSQVHSLAEYEGDLYFSGYDEDAGQVLHRFDGSSISPVPNSPAFPGQLAVANGFLYLLADSGALDDVLVAFDGATFTPVPESAGLQAFGIIGFNDDVYFIDRNTHVLYVYDPASSTVSPVLGAPQSGAPIVYDGRLIFGTALGDVWQIDTTGVASAIPGSSGANGLLGVHDGLVYLQFSSALGSFDGSTFTVVPGSPAEPIAAASFDGSLYFVAQGDVFGEYVMYRYDGSIITRLPGSPTDGDNLTAVGDHLYFVATELNLGAVWSYDSSGFSPLGPARNAGYLTAYDGTLYFAASPDGSGEDYRLMRAVVDPGLAATGADVSAPLAVGVIALLVGAALLPSRRRAMS